VELEAASFVCRAVGSNPPAQLLWSWAPGGPDVPALPKPIGGQQELASSSLLELEKLSWRHDGAQLVCTATNNQLPLGRPNRSLSARLKLSVKCESGDSQGES